MLGGWTIKASKTTGPRDNELNLPGRCKGILIIETEIVCGVHITTCLTFPYCGIQEALTPLNAPSEHILTVLER